MPRITAKNKEYKISDLSKYISGEMWAQDITQKEMAYHLGITQQGFGYKLSHNNFSYGDLLTIFDVLGTSEEKKVELMSLNRRTRNE